MDINRTIKILLVEDSKTTRKMELKVLSEIGFHQVTEADDGEAAIAILNKQGDIGLIISDWNMPNRDGFELLQWVRANKSTSHIPFIMATSRGEKKETAKAAEAGVSSLVTKPFSPAELNTIIESIFDQSKAAKGPLVQKAREGHILPSGKLNLQIAHIQITDHLGLGVLKHLISTGTFSPKFFELETQCMTGWNPVQQALENGNVDAAFVLAPIAMDLFGFGTPIKLALLAHKNGSICVQKRRTDPTQSLQSFFKNKFFYIPHAMSIHHILSHQFLKQIGLKPGVPGRGDVDVMFEVVAPIRMTEFLASNSDACGFMVAEPMGTKAIAEGIAEQLFLSGELWDNHPCCILAVRDEIIDNHPEALQEFASLLVQSGQFISKRPDSAAEIAVGFLDPNKTLGLKASILRNVLKEPNGIRTNDLFPIAEDFERMQQYMVNERGIGNIIDIGSFIDTRFAEIACRDTASGRRRSTVGDINQISMKILNRQKEGTSAKNMLSVEGRYLFFSLNNQEYGIEIISVKEVVQMMDCRSIPQAPLFVKGVINLRGKVIPIIDLGVKFDLKNHEYGERSCIIILEIQVKDHQFTAGIMVDSVSEVAVVKADDTEESLFLSGEAMNYILAMAKVKNTVKILLNASKLFTEFEAQTVQTVI